MKIGNLEVYGIIYKITNNVNRKIYIGQTTEGFTKRYKGKGTGIQRVFEYLESRNKNNHPFNSYLLKSIKKYGTNAFTVSEIIDIAFSRYELDIKEQCYISIYNSFNNGYNFTIGGGGTKGHKMSLSNKIKLIESNKKADRHGSKNPYFGKNHSNEIKKKMSENHYNCSGSKNPSSRKVICTTTNKIFNTIKEASEFYKCPSTSLNRVCTNERKYSGKLSDGTKLQWQYYEDYIKEEQKKLICF